MTDLQRMMFFLTLAMIHPTCLHLCTKLLSKARKGDAIHPEKSALFTIYWLSERKKNGIFRLSKSGMMFLFGHLAGFYWNHSELFQIMWAFPRRVESRVRVLLAGRLRWGPCAVTGCRGRQVAEYQSKETPSSYPIWWGGGCVNIFIQMELASTAERHSVVSF